MGAAFADERPQIETCNNLVSLDESAPKMTKLALSANNVIATVFRHTRGIIQIHNFQKVD